MSNLCHFLSWLWKASFNVVETKDTCKSKVKRTKRENGDNGPILIQMYIRIQPKTIDLSIRLWGINTEFLGCIPPGLMLRSVVCG